MTMYQEAWAFLAERIQYYDHITAQPNVVVLSIVKQQDCLPHERDLLDDLIERFDCSEAAALAAIFDLLDRYPRVVD